MAARARGFDQTIHESQDEFGREFLVENVYNLLMRHQPEWSVRVALNGDWGSGKTSIAEDIERRARAAGHAVGWLYPWQVNTSKDVAIALTSAVLTALEHAKVALPGVSGARKLVAGSIKQLKRFGGLHKGAEIGLGLLEDASAFDADFASPIAKQLKEENKRLLIIIDDLDRCEPSFLAPLLLFMRSVLDIQSFSFLAPFDSDVVSKALYISNSAWSSADRFLEKVFDFRIPIPDLTIEQKTRFLVSQLAKAGLIISDIDARPCATLLPGTPRAIKALARDIGTTENEIKRRSPGELSWPLLLLATMLRATNLEFFRSYLRDVVDTFVEEEKWGRRTEENRKNDLDAIWEVVASPDPTTRRRVRQLVEALEQESTGIDQLRPLHFTDKHEPVTQRECDEFVERWQTFGLTEALARVPLAETRPNSEVGAYLASCATSGYLRILEDIGQTVSASLRDRRLNHVKRGRDYLAVISELLTLIGQDQADHRFDLFVRLLVAERDSDRTLPDTHDMHATALQILEQFCASAKGHWIRYDGCISEALPLEEKQADIAWKVDVSMALRQHMTDSARKELLRLLQVVHGLDDIFRGHSASTQLGLLAHVFLDPCDVFWHETNAPAILAAAPSQPVIRENAAAAIRGILKHVSPAGSHDTHWALMRMHMEKRPAYSVEGLISRFLKSEVQLRVILTAYASGRTGESDVDETRAKLVLLGAPANALGDRPE
jgi:hypothetical protein